MTVRHAKTFYDFVDQPLTELDAQQGLLITCMRIWARGAMARTCPLRLVAPRFVLIGQASTLVPFHAFMMALSTGAARAIGLSSRENGCITEDEALLLTAFEGARHASAVRIKSALASIVCAQNLDCVVHRTLMLPFTLQ